MTVELGKEPELSVVVPAYCEAENLPILMERIQQALQQRQINYEVIVVDDNSPDQTPRIAQELQAAGHPLRLIVRTDERGLSSAVIRGLGEAQGTYLACMDADLSHPADALPCMLDRLRSGVGGPELVIGSRYIAGGSTDDIWGPFRRLNSKVATLLALPLARGVKDPMAGFFMLPKAVYARAEQLNPIGYKILLELICKCRVCEIAETPIHFQDRQLGQSKLSLKEQLRYLRHLYRLYCYRYPLFFQLTHFCSVGASGVLVDLSAVHLFYHGIAASMPLARSAGIATAMIWNFWLNRHITFRESRHAAVLPQFVKFVAACSFGAVLNWAISMAFFLYVPWFAGRVARCALVGIVAATASNFLLSRRFAFARPQDKVQQPPVVSETAVG